MNAKKILPLLISLVLLSAVAYAEESFEATSRAPLVGVCSCDSFQDTITVVNTGSSLSGYTITGNLVWATYYPDTFILNPGESVDVATFATVPCGVSGDYRLKTSIITDKGYLRELTQDIVTSICPNIDAMITDQTEESCPCKPISVEFNVKNSGSFLETYWFGLTKLNDYVSFTENPIILNPGESRQVTAFVSLPCETYGDFQDSLMISSQSGTFKDTLPFSFVINPCYEYELSVPASVDICEHEQVKKSVLINNIADIANKYQMSISGAHFAELEQDSLELSPKEPGSISVLIRPTAGDAGNYELAFNTISERGELSKNATMAVRVERCYDHSVSFEEDHDVVCCGDRTYTVMLTNFAGRSDVYELSSSHGILTSTIVAADSNQTVTVDLTLDLPCNESQSAVAVTAVSQATGVTNEAILDLEVLDQRQCTDLVFSPEKVLTLYKNITIAGILKNSGIENATYFVSYEAPSWISLDAAVIELAPGEQQEFDIKLEPSDELPEGDYPLVIQFATDSQTYQFTVNVQLRHTFAEKMDMFYQYVILANKEIFMMLLLFVLLVILVLIYRALSRMTQRKLREEMTSGDESEIAVSVIAADEPSSTKQWKVMHTGTFNSMVVDNPHLDITKVEIIPTRRVKDAALAIRELDHDTSALHTLQDEIYQAFNFKKDNLNDADISEAVVKFRVERYWLKQYGIDARSVSLQRYRGGRWSAFPAKIKGKDQNYVYYETTVNGFSYFAITGRQKALIEDKPRPSILPWLAILLIVLLGVVFAYYYTTYEPAPGVNVTISDKDIVDTNKLAVEANLTYIRDNGLEDSVFYQVMPLDTQATIDLSEYFYEPDAEQLTYHSTNPQNMTIEITDEGVATITPHKGFYGVRVVNFAATDPSGAIAYSDPITVIVTVEEGAEATPASKVLLQAILIVIVIYVLIIYLPTKIASMVAKEKKKK